MSDDIDYSQYFRSEDWGAFCDYPKPRLHNHLTPQAKTSETVKVNGVRKSQVARRGNGGHRPQGNPRDFHIGQAVRYKPGCGTYGYEHVVEADGRIPARVTALTPQRVQILAETRGVRVRLTVDAASLIPVERS